VAVTGPSLADGIGGRVHAGGKAFIPYVTAGLPGVEPALLVALQEAGADAIEVGVPFSDPVMDGPVIQEASRRALEGGATPSVALALVAEAGLDVPAVVMTYVNPVLAHGEDRFVTEARSAGVAGAIVPDLPVDEAGEWIARCRAAALAPVFLAAPNSSPERLRDIAAASEGFVYCVSTYGVTGARRALSGSAREVVEALRALTATPAVVGVGISTPEQAAEACTFADGVVVGSALVRCLLDGDPVGAVELARAFRRAIPGP
jgi:tryptophan synthase alpha chain